MNADQSEPIDARLRYTGFSSLCTLCLGGETLFPANSVLPSAVEQDTPRPTSRQQQDNSTFQDATPTPLGPHPYHSWERGTNENTNGLLRQYLPKGSDLTLVTSEQLRSHIRQLNYRPRKCLGFQNPFEVFHAKPSG